MKKAWFLPGFFHATLCFVKFLFQKPYHDDRLSNQANLAIAIGALSSRLVNELRTRTVHPDNRRENVAEHTLMLVKVSISLAQEYYPDLDPGKVAIFASLHDDVEAYVGDTPTDSVAQHDPDAKKKREEAGLKKLISEYSVVAPMYVQGIKEYETQQIPEARFVRVVDKLMVELIHIPNKGAELRKYYDKSSARQATLMNAEKLKRQYPEFGEMIDVRSEIARYLIATYIPE